MINANELRIGNLVFVGRHTIVIDEIHSGIISSYDPIPLTPKILEKCGFIFESEGFIYSGENYDRWENEILLSKIGDRYFSVSEVNDHDYNYPFGIELKYLHQLQNIYFALIGKELTVNL